MNWSSLFVMSSGSLINLGKSATPRTTVESTSPEGVSTVFNELIALIPKEDNKNVTQAHLNADEGFRAAVVYMHSEEWVNLIETIGGNPDWIALKKYLRDSGIDLDTSVKYITNLIENATLYLQPRIPTAKKNLMPYLVDLVATIPTVKIITLLQEKRAKGENFKQLYARLSSKELHGLTEKVFALLEIKQAMNELADMGLDMSNFISLFYSANGWGEFKT